MKATYDRRSDSLAITLAYAEVEETINIAPGVEVDYDSSGRVVAIEILHTSDKYDVTEVIPIRSDYAANSMAQRPPSVFPAKAGIQRVRSARIRRHYTKLVLLWKRPILISRSRKPVSWSESAQRHCAIR